MASTRHRIDAPQQKNFQIILKNFEMHVNGQLMAGVKGADSLESPLFS